MIVSLLGIGAAQIALMGERGVRNERDSQIAKQGAEEALINAEIDMLKGSRTEFFKTPNNFKTNCGTTGQLQGLCAQATTGQPIWLAADLTGSQSTQVGTFASTTMTSGSGIQPAKLARYIVELLPDRSINTEAGLSASRGGEKFLHRVTAIGFGPREDIKTVLQMVYRIE